MPELYLKIKKEYEDKGKSEKDAKTIAAKIYNSVRKKKPSLPKLSNRGDK